MADEEVKNTEDKKEIDFNNTNEPIESIEKTVEDLKKKIQELADAQDKTDAPAPEGIHADDSEESEEDNFTIPEFANQEQKESTDGFKETAAKTVSDSLTQLKTGAEKVMSNPDLQKTVAYIKENAMKAIDTVKSKVSEIAENPAVQQTTQKAAETLKTAGEKVQEVIKPVAQNVDEFMKKPEVQNTIEKVRTTAAETVVKVSDTVKDLINKDDSE